MSSPNKSWTVVLFIEDQTVEAVPSRWINGDSCLWPAVPRDKLLHLLKNCEYNSCWPSLPVRIFRNATYDNFCVARAKATKAEATSELNTETSDYEANDLLTRVSKRKPKRKILSSSSSSDSTDEIMQPKISKLTIKKTTKNKLPPAPVWQEEELDHDPEENIENAASNATIISNREHTSQHQIAKAFDNTNYSNTTTTGKSADTTVLANNRCNCNPQILYNIQSILMEMNEKINSLLKQKTHNPEKINDTNILQKSMVRYPMETEDSLDRFEEFFSSTENYTNLVSYFANQGGNNLYEYIKRCLAPIVGDILAQKFSFTGKKGKQSFYKFTITKAIIDSALKVGISTNKKDVELKIADWLRRAPERKRRTDIKNRDD